MVRRLHGGLEGKAVLCPRLPVCPAVNDSFSNGERPDAGRRAGLWKKPFSAGISEAEAKRPFLLLTLIRATFIFMNILRKALQRGLTPANVTSYVCLQVMRIWGAFWGTLRLRCKAFCLGAAVGPGVRAHGPVGLLRWPGSTISIGANAA